MFRAIRWGLLVVAYLGAAACAEARTWRVEKDGSGDFKAIQPAIDAAAPGDTVRLGVGRWTEYAPLNSQGKWLENVYVHVTVDSLTIKGAGSDQSIVGPTSVTQPPAEWPKGICALSDVQRLRVEGLTVEHIRDGLYFSKGLLEVRSCTFRGGYGGIISWGERGNVVQACQFLDNFDNGVIGVAGAGGFIVEDCLFSNNGTGVDFYTLNALVQDCTFTGGLVGAQFTEGAVGTVRNCRFDSINNCSLVMATDAQVLLQGSRLLGGGYAVYLDSGARLSGSGNVFAGARFATFQIYACTPDLHGNHILHGRGPTILMESFPAPMHTIDMSGNYWGTDNADSIAAWIHDGYDDSSVFARIQFEPFSATPLPAKKETVGGLKALFR